MKFNFYKFLIFSISLLLLAQANSYRTKASDEENISVKTVISSGLRTEKKRVLIIFPPDGSMALDENFKRIKHEMINCCQTQIFDDYFPKECNGLTVYS